MTKRFPGVVAVDDVSLGFRAGKVHVLPGQNGAGKSTIAGILAGLQEPDEGHRTIDGKDVRLRSPAESLKRGITSDFQHVMLVPTFKVFENLVLGDDLWRRPPRRTIERRVAELSREFVLRLRLDAGTGDLSLGEQQQIEIARALLRDSQVLILDEATSMLTPQGADELGKRMRLPADRGLTRTNSGDHGGWNCGAPDFHGSRRIDRAFRPDHRDGPRSDLWRPRESPVPPVGHAATDRNADGRRGRGSRSMTTVDAAAETGSETESSHTRPGGSGWRHLLLTTVGPIACAIVASGLILLAFGIDPLACYSSILRRGLLSWLGLEQTLTRMAALLFLAAGLIVASSVPGSGTWVWTVSSCSVRTPPLPWHRCSMAWFRVGWS